MIPCSTIFLVRIRMRCCTARYRYIFSDSIWEFAHSIWNIGTSRFLHPISKSTSPGKQYHIDCSRPSVICTHWQLLLIVHLPDQGFMKSLYCNVLALQVLCSWLDMCASVCKSQSNVTTLSMGCHFKVLEYLYDRTWGGCSADCVSNEAQWLVIFVCDVCDCDRLHKCQVEILHFPFSLFSCFPQNSLIPEEHTATIGWNQEDIWWISSTSNFGGGRFPWTCFSSILFFVGKEK